MRIIFISDPKLPNDLKHLGYKSGMEVDLPNDKAERWLRRGVAQIVAKGGAPARPALESPSGPPAPAAQPSTATPSHSARSPGLFRTTRSDGDAPASGEQSPAGDPDKSSKQ
jgi:hypothetical protein